MEDRQKEFREDAKSLPEEEYSHIGIGTEDEVLKELDRIYGAADALSVRYAKEYRRILALLSIAATIVTVAFLLYDEAELHWMILVCGIMILSLFLINRIANRLNCHRKYLEYRVLAESARVQIFTYYAGTKVLVSDIFPWTLQMNVPWIREILQNVMKGADPEKKRSIKECWVEDQRQYHIRALGNTETEERMNSRIVRVSLVLSIVFYLFALFFEIRFAGLFGGGSVVDTENAELTRTIIKILLGGMSAATLFTGNYFGKLSLDNAEEDHKRMIALYDLAEQKFETEGESERLILRLAREELNENSSWYSYQRINRPDISL